MYILVSRCLTRAATMFSFISLFALIAIAVIGKASRHSLILGAWRLEILSNMTSARFGGCLYFFLHHRS